MLGSSATSSSPQSDSDSYRSFIVIPHLWQAKEMLRLKLEIHGLVILCLECVNIHGLW